MQRALLALIALHCINHMLHFAETCNIYMQHLASWSTIIIMTTTTYLNSIYRCEKFHIETLRHKISFRRTRRKKRKALLLQFKWTLSIERM